MREKTIYVCEICEGTYSSKEIAKRCEDSGLPKHFDEFVGKWIILPVQTFIDKETLESSTTESVMEWFPVRVEKNTLTSPHTFDFMNHLKLETIAHSIKMATRSFKTHFVLKEFLDYAIIVEGSYVEKLNNLLVKHELERDTRTDDTPTKELKDLIEEVLKDKDLPPLQGVEKYEYKSST